MVQSKTGVWIDDDTGEVVFERPKGRGTQLVAQGGEITGHARQRAEVLGVTIPDEDKPVVDAPVEDAAPDAATADTTVTSESAPKPAAKKVSSTRKSAAKK